MRILWVRAYKLTVPVLLLTDRFPAFMLHISGHISLTTYALEKSGTLHGMLFAPLAAHKTLTCSTDLVPDLWDGFEGGFLNHLEQVKEDIAAATRPDPERVKTGFSRTLSHH